MFYTRWENQNKSKSFLLLLLLSLSFCLGYADAFIRFALTFAEIALNVDDICLLIIDLEVELSWEQLKKKITKYLNVERDERRACLWKSTWLQSHTNDQINQWQSHLSKFIELISFIVFFSFFPLLLKSQISFSVFYFLFGFLLFVLYFLYFM